MKKSEEEGNNEGRKEKVRGTEGEGKEKASEVKGKRKGMKHLN